MLHKAKLFFKTYQHYISPATVVCGFIFDNLTLRRIDVLFSNVVLISYLAISALSIMIVNIRASKQRFAVVGGAMNESVNMFFIFVMQFCLGGLFSASFLFYSKAGSIAASWPFLLMLIVYITGNELLRKNYVRLGFQMAVFFTALFSFLIFFLPVILGKMGDAIFLLSGITSLILIGLFIYILSWFAPDRTVKSAPLLLSLIGGIFLAINLLYFTNLIPPIPLALKEVGIYRSVNKLPDGSYATLGESQKWFNIFGPDPVVHVGTGATLYAFSAIFAPSNLTTDILHIWEYYDTVKKQWVVSDRINLGISGGREQGFRTFSAKEGIFPGLWRVDVRTPRGQLIGRLSFTVESATGSEKLIQETV